MQCRRAKTKGITMYKYLFFDDQRLFIRQNLDRKYGVPEPLADSVYKDPYLDTTLPGTCVFRRPDGKYHMIYQGFGDDPAKPKTQKADERKGFPAAAVSDDGIHFVPLRDEGAGEHPFPHMLTEMVDGEFLEIGYIVEDPAAPPEERYKALMASQPQKTLRIRDYIMASGDLVHWRKLPGEWNPVGPEPVVCCLRNPVRDCFTILSRPDWGQRRVGYSETKDFKTFTELAHCIQVDSLDDPLAELYGMPAIEYNGRFIGFPLLYSDIPQKLGMKFFNGTMHCQLAYSLDGRNFQRSLREPFLCGWSEEVRSKLNTTFAMVWPTSALCREDGSILIYSAASTGEHGNGFRERGAGAIFVSRLRADGFIRLVSQRRKTAVLATRHMLWHGGEAAINLKCTGPATAAVYGYDVDPGKPLPGFDHSDCEPFTGDSTAWQPKWRGGPLDAHRNECLVIELRFSGGEVYSIGGDCTPMMFLEARRFHELSELPPPPCRGW